MEVRPRQKVLSGTGYVWEYILCEMGWNELSEDQRGGTVVEQHFTASGDRVFDVYWPALKIETRNVFVDEVDVIA